MIGTWVNVGAIVLGGFLGCLLKRGIPQRINESILKVEGIAILVISLNGIIGAMFTADPQTGALSDSGGLLLLVSLVLGCLIGELLRIDDHLNNLGKLVESRIGASGFAKGFVTATLIFSVGAMSIVGALNDGLTGDSSILFIKSTLDFTTGIVLASSLGMGVIFAAVPVLVVQGGIALLAGIISPYISDSLLAMFSMVGYAMVLAIALNFVADTKIKVANLLPALVCPVVYYFLFM